MKKLLALLLLAVAIGCSKSNPTGPGITAPPVNQPYAAKFDTMRCEMYGTSNYQIIASYFIRAIDTTISPDTLIFLELDTIEYYCYLSNGRNFHGYDRSPWANTDSTGTWLMFTVWGSTTIGNLVLSDTLAHIDSLVVSYWYYRYGAKYGPHRNKHVDPPATFRHF